MFHNFNLNALLHFYIAKLLISAIITGMEMLPYWY